MKLNENLGHLDLIEGQKQCQGFAQAFTFKRTSSGDPYTQKFTMEIGNTEDSEIENLQDGRLFGCLAKKSIISI